MILGELGHNLMDHHFQLLEPVDILMKVLKIKDYLVVRPAGILHSQISETLEG